MAVAVGLENFRLAQWLIIDVSSFLVLLHHLLVCDVAAASEVMLP
jgi:hypothetical protein